MKKLSLAFLFLAACSGGTASNSLGVTSVEVAETATTLRIDAFDARHALLGKVSLELGRFATLDDERMVDGRRLLVDAAGKQATHVSEGLKALVLPALAGEPGEALALPEVNAALGRWQVGVATRAARRTERVADVASAETPHVTCGYATSPSCAATSCADRYESLDYYTCEEAAFETVCCSGPKQAIKRECGRGSENTCGTEGPNGCAVCWGEAYTSTCSAFLAQTTVYCSEDQGNWRSWQDYYTTFTHN